MFEKMLIILSDKKSSGRRLGGVQGLNEWMERFIQKVRFVAILLSCDLND